MGIQLPPLKDGGFLASGIARFRIDSADSRPVIDLARDGSLNARIAVANSANEITPSTTSGDAVIRVQSNDLFFTMDGGTTSHVVFDSSGSVGIGTTSPTSTLHVDGTGNFSGYLYAGSCTNQTNPLNQTCTDIAELFPAEIGLEAGDVVCLKQNGKAGFCEKEFDNKILGVISTNPAIIIKGDNLLFGTDQDLNFNDKMPIALKGRVPVKVDCRVPIKEGDLLVSAERKGYAMKFNLLDERGADSFEELKEINYVNSRRRGVDLGKSLESCESGEKIIMAWVG